MPTTEETSTPTPPALGTMVQVQVAADVVLRNSQSGGGHFEPEVPTWQRVTLTLLRRLKDGDLTLVPPSV